MTEYACVSLTDILVERPAKWLKEGLLYKPRLFTGFKAFLARKKAQRVRMAAAKQKAMLVEVKRDLSMALEMAHTINETRDALKDCDASQWDESIVMLDHDGVLGLHKAIGKLSFEKVNYDGLPHKEQRKVFRRLEKAVYCVNGHAFFGTISFRAIFQAGCLEPKSWIVPLQVPFVASAHCFYLLCKAVKNALLALMKASIYATDGIVFALSALCYTICMLFFILTWMVLVPFAVGLDSGRLVWNMVKVLYHAMGRAKIYVGNFLAQNFGAAPHL